MSRDSEGVEDAVDVDVVLVMLDEPVVSIVAEVEEVEELVDEVEWSPSRSTIDPTGTGKELPFWQQVELSGPQQYVAAPFVVVGHGKRPFPKLCTARDISAYAKTKRIKKRNTFAESVAWSTPIRISTSLGSEQVVRARLKAQPVGETVVSRAATCADGC